MTTIHLDSDKATNREWKEIIAEKLKTATSFEIHCWAEEADQIAMLLPFGELKESSWQYGKVIRGRVTPEFTTYLLGLPKPSDTEIYNKMTPFFSIFLDDNFSSEHYGTEITKE